MRQFLTILFFALSASSFGQTTKRIDSVTFCSNKYQVPINCVAQSEYQVKCDDYSLIWIYMDKAMFRAMPDQLINQMSMQLKKFKKEKIACYLLDKEVTGYKTSFKKDSETSYQLIAYGVVNEQPVFVQLLLDKEPKSNDDIPDFARQIIKLTK